MIYLLSGVVVVSVLFAAGGGTYLILEGLSRKKFSYLFAGILAFVGVFAFVIGCSDLAEKPEDHCGVGTDYVPEINGHDWYCKVDKDY